MGFATVVGSYPAQTDAIVGNTEVDVATTGPETCRAHKGAATPMPARPLQTSDATVVAARDATPSLAIEADGVMPPGVYQEVFLRVVAPVKLTAPLEARLATDVCQKRHCQCSKLTQLGTDRQVRTKWYH